MWYLFDGKIIICIIYYSRFLDKTVILFKLTFQYLVQAVGIVKNVQYYSLHCSNISATDNNALFSNVYYAILKGI